MTPSKAIEVVIPTRNDYLYLEKILKTVTSIDLISAILIVDNSTSSSVSKEIKKICNQFGKVNYFFSSIGGKGNAIRLGISQTTKDVLFLDADLENLSKKSILALIKKFNECDVVKASFSRSNGQSNSSFVKDQLQVLFPGLAINKPTGGIYLVKKEVLEKVKIPASWSVDMSLVIQAYQAGFRIGEVEIGKVKDKARTEMSLQMSKRELIAELKVMGETK
ncbi:MAG: glycosyltransferase [Candidatus Nanoarchaeia archaeon]